MPRTRPGVRAASIPPSGYPADELSAPDRSTQDPSAPDRSTQDRSAPDRSTPHLAATTSASTINHIVSEIAGASQRETRHNWLRAVAALVVGARPDIRATLLQVLGVSPRDDDLLAGLSIGEVGACYEALLARLDRGRRRDSGQFFTPDDAARFMAVQSTGFPAGVWLDPCCGVGNLSWHLAGAQADPAAFIKTHLVLVDEDETALVSAVALIGTQYAAPGDGEAVRSLRERAVRRDFLSRARLPDHDFVIANPPYAKAPERRGYETGRCRDLFAYFMERVVKESRGFIAVTPASYLSAPKFALLRNVLDRESSGGEVVVFDNVPDTLFRGYKFGSHNTSKTNFVRAAVTVCAPEMHGWRVTPIIRWQAADRTVMFQQCQELLEPRRIGPHGEWVKVPPSLGTVWDGLASETQTLADLVVDEETEFRLDVALTPRYFVSATYRGLDRTSKAVLHFATPEDCGRAAIVLNSSIPYLWWRALDGGVNLPRRVLFSVPIPAGVRFDAHLVARLRQSEDENLVVKLNAGRINENVKHPPTLVGDLDAVVMPGGVHGRDLRILYTNSMFPLNSQRIEPNELSPVS